MHGTGKQATQIKEEAIDTGARAGRERRVMPDHHMDRGRTKKRAETARDKTIGESVKMTATMVGFRDDAGELWTTGHLIYCESVLGHIARLGVEEQLDVGSHSPERPAQHHDVRVIVRGGRLTTRTCCAAAT